MQKISISNDGLHHCYLQVTDESAELKVIAKGFECVINTCQIKSYSHIT